MTFKKRDSLPAGVLISGQVCKVVPLKGTPGQLERFGVANVEAPDGYTFSGGESALVLQARSDLADILATEMLVTCE